MLQLQAPIKVTKAYGDLVEITIFPGAEKMINVEPIGIYKSSTSHLQVIYKLMYPGLYP